MYARSQFTFSIVLDLPEYNNDSELTNDYFCGQNSTFFLNSFPHHWVSVSFQMFTRTAATPRDLFASSYTYSLREGERDYETRAAPIRPPKSLRRDNPKAIRSILMIFMKVLNALQMSTVAGSKRRSCTCYARHVSRTTDQ